MLSSFAVVWHRTWSGHKNQGWNFPPALMAVISVPPAFVALMSRFPFCFSLFVFSPPPILFLCKKKIPFTRHLLSLAAARLKLVYSVELPFAWVSSSSLFGGWTNNLPYFDAGISWCPVSMYPLFCYPPVKAGIAAGNLLAADIKKWEKKRFNFIFFQLGQAVLSLFR